MADPGISKPGARSRCGNILRSGICFDALSHIPYVFVVRVVDINTYCKHCMLTKIKVYACYTVNIYNNTPPPKKFKPRGARLARRSWICLWLLTVDEIWFDLLNNVFPDKETQKKSINPPNQPQPNTPTQHQLDPPSPPPPPKKTHKNSIKKGEGVGS